MVSPQDNVSFLIDEISYIDWNSQFDLTEVGSQWELQTKVVLKNNREVLLFENDRFYLAKRLSIKFKKMTSETAIDEICICIE